MLEEDVDEPPPRARAIPFLLAALVTAVLLFLALHLGTWAYSHRRLSLHRERLERALAQKPTADVLSAGLRAEPGVREVRDPDLLLLREEDRKALAGRLRSAAAVRVFSVDDDLVYVLLVGPDGEVQVAAVVEVKGP